MQVGALMTYLIVLAVTLLALAVFVRWVEPRLAFFPFPGEAETPRNFGLAFEALTIETTDGERLRAWLIPAGTPRARVLYFHGNGGNLSNWSPILAGDRQPRLLRPGRRLPRLRPEHGTSDRAGDLPRRRRPRRARLAGAPIQRSP